MLATEPSVASDYRARLMLGDRIGRAVQPPDWFAESYEIFQAIVSNPAYPCHFGSAAESRGELYYTIADSCPGQTLARTLQNFLASARLAARQRRNLTIFFPPDERPLGITDYQERFWSTLEALSEADPSPWPEHISSQPDSPDWEFCFAGEPIFVFCGAPCYRLRSSRNLGPGMIILMQPRSSFFGIEGDSRAGIEARKKTRERLAQWDQMPAHPDLGVYGDAANREWKQYALPDSNSRVTGKCPFLNTGAGGLGNPDVHMGDTAPVNGCESGHW
ncbi:YqcI/YcgG family protein [Candidatus Accumulibacter phosphatis]|uniref:YqcI/YcgG family protein n=2 Tax=Candidatus Accumulibacter phosphatis TaxID=327160 RepID=A0ABX1TS32_9PROT|nr:YqcI/YcgG family protein [Candidatus Accumulibacter phosphatis]